MERSKNGIKQHGETVIHHLTIFSKTTMAMVLREAGGKSETESVDEEVDCDLDPFPDRFQW